jgi:phosphoenolpyruvate-protein kinase (PTS system EI component)
MTTPHELAWTAADQVRALTECTARPGAYPYPTDAHHTLGALAGLLEQLPQTLHQTAAELNAMPEAQLTVLSDPPIPARVQARITTDLGHAIAALQEAAAHLRQAQHATAELVYTGPIADP